MKHLDKLIPMAMGLALLTSCADNDMPFFGVTDPGTNAQYAYLNEYDVLKNYINPNANPNFKLGLGVDAGSFDAGNAQYQIAATNFNEVTPGNEMKYASIVGDDGSMNFSTVANMIEDAKAANLTIYGHTLAWHAQQNNTYLNGLIAPIIIPGEAGDGGYCLILKNETAQANIYGAQTWYQLPSPLQSGTTYTLRFMAKASVAYNPEIYLQCSDGGNQEYPGGFSVGTEWQEVTVNLTPSGSSVDKIAFNFGTAAVNIYIDNISLTAPGSTENLISNGDFENKTITGWTGWTPGLYETISADGEGYSSTGGESAYQPSSITNTDFESGTTGWGGWGDNITLVQSAVGNGYQSDYSFEISHPNAVDPWAAQVAWDFAQPLVQGGTYRLQMWIKGSVDGSISAGFQRKSDYAGAGDFPTIPVTTEWTQYTSEITVSGSGADCADRFLFNVGAYVGTLNIDNVTLCYKDPNAGGQVIEKTPEEKKEILTNAMDQWSTGIMNATGGYVTTWDAVNEAISGGDSDGDDDDWYDLQSAATSDDPANNFYWQDYLTPEDYVPIVTKLAAQRFEEAGGDPSQLKLFINDYNLEATWDNNKKLESLIHWISVWEAKGAKIDGIGTQMHVSYILNPTQQKAQEDAIVRMFQLMAATGKLVKISELDMGIVENQFEDAKKSEDVTYEEKLKMADFYKFIIEKYFEIIPQSQQYGITQWCCTYSPADSGWRPGEPCGLWDSNYNRTPMYGGFANGLAGKVIVEPSPVPGDGSDAGAVE